MTPIEQDIVPVQVPDRHGAMTEAVKIRVGDRAIVDIHIDVVSIEAIYVDANGNGISSHMIRSTPEQYALWGLDDQYLCTVAIEQLNLTAV